MEKLKYMLLDNRGNFWFFGKDTANALGYNENIRAEAVRTHVPKTDKLQLKDINVYVKGIHTNSIYINETGLYTFLMESGMPNAKPFVRLLTEEVLPAIRKYGQYKLNQELKNQQNEMFKKINYLTKENKKLKNDLKKDVYPHGGMVYAIDYSDEEEEVYRIGMTDDMNLRKQIYDTHSLHKRDVVIFREFKHPLRLEICVRSMLYEFRFKNRKDFYVCPFDKIKRAFSICLRSFRSMDRESKTISGSKTKQVQRGGQMSFIDKQINISEKKNLALQKKINKFDKLLLDRRR